MCIALPVRVVAILDEGNLTVAVEGGSERREEASAALVAQGAAELAALPGRWALVHAGYLLSLIDEREARSRLAVFAAMEGLPVTDEALRPDERDPG